MRLVQREGAVKEREEDARLRGRDDEEEVVKSFFSESPGKRGCRAIGQALVMTR